MQRHDLSLRLGLAGGFALLVLTTGIGRAEDPPKLPTQSVQPTAEQVTFFESKIRPLLATKCYSCHGVQQQSADLRVDSREAMLKGNAHGPVLIPGDPAKSSLISVVHYDGKIKMPPSGKLSSLEIAALTSWVKMGAPWPSDKLSPSATPPKEYKVSDAQKNFWSFKPVKKSSLPKVSNMVWCQNPIDRFVLAKLEEKGLKPAPSADRRSLIRRATFDVVGLPPSPEEIDAFVNDKSSNAWEKVVDRLLASPHYGETWGRHWLDLVRYADSNGLDENVAFANAFRYRDYVIDSFNADKPYPEFIKEQLAGDLMLTGDDEKDNARLTATGFLELGPKLLAEPDKQKMVMDIVDEQIEVTSKAFLGLTVACARCHNHKFDPIPTKDYYALAGIFRSTRSMETLNTVGMWKERRLKNGKHTTQQIAEEEKTKAVFKLWGDQREQATAQLISKFQADAGKYLQASWELLQQPGVLPIAERIASSKEGGAQVLEAEKFTKSSGIAIDTKNYGKGIGVLYNVSGNDMIEWTVDIPTAGNYELDFRYASGESRPCRLSLNGKMVREDAVNKVTGGFFAEQQKWDILGVFPFIAGKNIIKLENPNVIPHFDKLAIAPAHSGIDGSPVRSLEQIAKQFGVEPLMLQHIAKLASVVKTDPSKLSPENLKAETDKFAKAITIPAKAYALYPVGIRDEIVKYDKALDEKKSNAMQAAVVMAVEEGEIADCKVHIRGDAQTLGDEVPRHFLTILGGDKISIDKKRSGRLELAEWIARPEHPLTSRVAVNRIWQGHFGQGLVKTPDNYGLLGAFPTHPELFDWLAASFVEKSGSQYACNWSFKKLNKLILMSNTFKQSTTPDAKSEAIGMKADTDNSLLWKYPRRRLEAEPFRDSLLAMSGKLDLSMGGSVMTTKNHDYVTNDQSGNSGQYDSPRRAIYLPLIRNAMFDMFLAFDVGDPSMVNAKRATTTVAPQALFVMNSPFVSDQATGFANSLLAKKELTDAQRYNLACLRAFGRTASSAESTRAVNYLNAYAARLTMEPDLAKRHTKSWSSLCHILLASNEFIYLN